MLKILDQDGTLQVNKKMSPFYWETDQIWLTVAWKHQQTNSQVSDSDKMFFKFWLVHKYGNISFFKLPCPSPFNPVKTFKRNIKK